MVDRKNVQALLAVTKLATACALRPDPFGGGPPADDCSAANPSGAPANTIGLAAVRWDRRADAPS